MNVDFLDKYGDKSSTFLTCNCSMTDPVGGMLMEEWNR